jgi:hypothetical protein
MRAPAARQLPPDSGSPMKPQAAAEPEAEGLKGLARKLTMRRSSDTRAAEPKSWEMKTLLAAAEQDSGIRLSKSDKLSLDTAATLGALETALADMAIDLSALDTAEASEGDWKRYLSGDRAVFARRLADTIDETAVDRITTLYRDDKKFHHGRRRLSAEFEKC